MRKYTLKELTIKITGAKECEMYWDSVYQQIRRIDNVIKRLTGTREITDINIDKYIEVCKEIYDDKDKMLIINKYYKVLNSTEIKNGVMTVPFSKKNITNEEQIVIYQILLKFFKGENICYFLEQAITEIISEEYNKVVLEFEEEVKKLKFSIQGYNYEARLEKLKEITKYLKNQRIQIDKNILENTIIK